MAWLFEAPPSPFQTKLVSGTPINWNDPLSQGLLLCWGVNEGGGTNLLDAAWGSHDFNYRWGADSIKGTGVGLPFWTTYQQANALHLPTGAAPVGDNIQVLSPVYSGAAGKMRPLGDFRKGYTLEFWGQLDGDITHSYGFLGLEKVVGGQFIRFGSVGAVLDFRASGGPGPGFIQAPTYGTFAATPNHLVATITQKGEAHIYANGKEVASGALSYLTDEINVARLGWTGNVFDDRFAGYLFKASIYNCVLGPAAVQALAINPMRVFQSVNYPGVFASDALQVYQAYQLLEYVDGIIPPTVPSYPPPAEPPPQTTPPGTTGPPDRTPIVTPGFAPGFRIFQKDTEIRVKSWGASDAYSVVRPLGGDSFTKGADI